jgi:NAD-dependent deacetylase
MSLPDLSPIRRALASARRIVVLTGAGVSAGSGIPTFRSGAPGGMEALWKSFDPQTLATPEAFARDPKLVTEWYDWRRQKCRDALPNPAHLALAELERRMSHKPSAPAQESPSPFTLLTQNVDRLHHRAGSQCVIELHGNIMHWRCAITNLPADIPDGPFPHSPVPSPHHPGAFLRPSIVWFGEQLPHAALQSASAAVHALTPDDLFLTIGTSAVVYPAAGFIDLAVAQGARTLEINRDPTPYSRRVTWSLMGDAADILPALINP